MSANNEPVIMGRISGLYGVRGWVKVYSYSEPRDNILQYTTWLIRPQGGKQAWREIGNLNGRVHGKGIVVQLEGVNDRDMAASLIGYEIAIRREQFPALEEGEFYWADLEGLRVLNQDDVDLGTVKGLFSTGANDVMVVKGERERLIPFIREQVIRSIDLAAGEIRVDWDPEF